MDFSLNEINVLHSTAVYGGSSLTVQNLMYYFSQRTR